MNIPTIANTVSGIQTSQQTLGQALSTIESDVKDILAALSIPGGDIPPPNDLTGLVSMLNQVLTALGTPATGSIASEIEANADAIASLASTSTQLVSTVNAISDALSQVNSTVSANSDALATANTGITNLGTSIAGVDGNVTSVGNQVSALSAQVANLQTSIANLASVVGDFNVPVQSQLIKRLLARRQ